MIRKVFNTHSNYMHTASWTEGYWMSASFMPSEAMTYGELVDNHEQQIPMESLSASWELGIENTEWSGIVLTGYFEMQDDGLWSEVE